MTWLFVFLFTFAIQFIKSEAARFDVDDPEGIVSIFLLILATIICIISLIFFFYIVYKLWNGDFRRRRRYERRISREKIIMHEQMDGRRDSTMKTKPVYSFHNEVAAAEEAREDVKTEVVETTVVEGNLKTEEVIVNQAPPTEEAEMETQELVVVFDDNDDVVEVLTHTHT